MEAPKHLGVIKMFNLIPLPYRIIAAILIVLSIFGYGYKLGYDRGERKIAEFKAKALAEYMQLQTAYEKAKNAVNEVVVTKYVDRIVYITKWRTKNVEIVKEVPSNCELSAGWVHVHDSAAEGHDADRSGAADGATSGVKDTEALATVVDNYSKCLQNTAQLTSLQEWVRQTQDYIKSLNESKWRPWKKKD